MSKAKELVQNIAIIGLGTISVKTLTFLLLPLYTKVLEPEDYGIIDVLMTMSTLIIPFAVLEINSGVFRFLIGMNYDGKPIRKEVISTGIAIETIGLIMSLIFLSFINILYLIPYFEVVVTYIFSLAVSKLLLDITRGFGNTVSYSVANVIITAVSLVLNIVLILLLKCGAVAILIATSIGNISGALFLFFKIKLYRYITIHSVSISLGKEILRFTIPLIPNTVSWWIVSVSDRIIILWFLGAAANGVYAAAQKIPGVYTTLFLTFCIAWAESAIRYINDAEFIIQAMRNSLYVMLYVLLIMISCTSLLFDILIGERYASCYWHIFILLIASFFSTLSSLYGGIIGGKMKSTIIARTTIVGAIINIIVNLALIKTFEIYAASVSTALSYIVVSLMREKHIRTWFKVNLFRSKDMVLIPISCLVLSGYVFQSMVLNIVSIFSIIGVAYIVNKDLIVNTYKMRCGD